MSVGDVRIMERGVLHGAAMKFAAINARPVKGSLPDSAHGKGAVTEIGEIKIRVVGYAVERHTVKECFAEKVWGKARLGRLVIEMLADNFQRALRVKVQGTVFVLLIAALGVGPEQERLLCQKCLYLSADLLHPLSVVLAARIPQAGQKGVHCPLCPALQNVIDCPYSFGAIRAVVVLRPHILQKISGLDADLAASFHLSMLVYNIRLLKVSRNVFPDVVN